MQKKDEKIQLIGATVFLTLKQKIFVAITFILGVILIVLGCCIPLIIDYVIKNKVHDQVVMTPSNIDMWGSIPGQSQVEFHRNCIFYQFLNPYDSIFRNEKPQILEIPGYNLIMKQQFQNSTFTDNGNTVTVNRFTRYENQENDEQEFEVVNVGALGFWHTIKNAKGAKLAFLGLGSIIENVEEQIPLNIYYLGLKYNLISTYQKAQTVLQVIDDENKRQLMWEDQYMGLSEIKSIENWVRAANEGNDFGVASKRLKDYFILTQEEISELNIRMRTLIKLLNDTAVPFYGCGIDEKYECDGRFYTAVQFANQDITSNPPPGLGIPAAESLSQVNASIHDYPELSYFYNEYFLKQVESGDEYKSIIFDVDWMMNLLKHDQFYQDSLMNIKSMEYFYEFGQKYDQSKNLEDLSGPMQRFGCTSLQQTRVIWEWLKQIEKWFVQRSNLGCTGECAGIGLQSSMGLLWAFYNMTNYLKPKVISNMVMNKQDWEDCPDMWKSSIEEISDESVSLLCDQYTISEFTLVKILEFCKQKYEPVWEQVGVTFKLSRAQLIQMCEDGSKNRSFQTLFDNANLDMDNQYNCKYEHCSEVEIAIKQWVRSEITLSPPPSCTLKPSYTAKEWNSNLYAFEYQYFLQILGDIFETPPTELTDDQAKQLLWSNNLFNSLQTTTAFAYAKSDLKQEFVDTFYFEEYEYLLQYLRYATFEIGLGYLIFIHSHQFYRGITMKKSAKQLLYGYQDDIIHNYQQKDPYLGGDPSVQTWLYLSDPSMTPDDAKFYPQSIYTGKEDLSKTRKFVSINGFESARYNTSDFDGYKLSQVWKNPWNIEESIQQGTDGVMNQPFLKSNTDLAVYIPQLYRVVKLEHQGNKDIYGLETYTYVVSDQFYEPQPDKYFSKYYGVQDLTQAYSAPVRVSQPHFYNTEQWIQDSVMFLNQDRVEQKASIYDDNMLQVEPYSGVPIQNVIQAQISLEVGKDELFINQNAALIPVLTLWNSGNMSEQFLNSQYGQEQLVINEFKVIQSLGQVQRIGPEQQLLFQELYFF